MNKSLVIIGFKAAGKTTVAKQLAKTLKMGMLDLDDLLLKRSGFKDIRECFNTLGAPAFRQNELAIAKELLTLNLTEPRIIATGGGAVLNDELMIILKQVGKVVFLNTDYQIIEHRLFSDQAMVCYLNRWMSRDDLKAIYQERLNRYWHYADSIILDSNAEFEIMGDD